MIGFLIRRGIVRSEQQAKQVLIGVIVVGALVILFLNRPGAHTPPPVETEEDILFEEMLEEEAQEMGADGVGE